MSRRRETYKAMSISIPDFWCGTNIVPCSHITKRRHTNTDIHRQNVKENVEEDHPPTIADLKEQPHGKSHPQRKPTAHKGAEAGGSAAKRIRQTEKHEKAKTKGRPEK
jgi:hypothetical protein